MGAAQLDSSSRMIVAQATAAALNVTDATGVLVQGSKVGGTAATNSMLAGMVYNSTPAAPTNGQQLSLQSDSIGNLSTVFQDIYITGQSAQTNTVNNIIPAVSGTNPTDAANYKSGAIQIVSTGTAGTFIFEQSNDNVNFKAMTVYDTNVQTGVAVTAAVTASVSQIIYTFPIVARYIRVRIATTITGGSIQAFTRLSQNVWTPATTLVTQSTGGNLIMAVASLPTLANVTTVATVSTVTSVTAVASVTSTINTFTNADQASAAITTTTNGATSTLTAGNAISFVVNVTSVTGTSPTYDWTLQSSVDGGTTWVNVYQLPRLTAAGVFTTPMIQLPGKTYRYVETISGGTPSFTRTITSNRSLAQGQFIRNIIDRNINPTATNSTSSSLQTDNAQSFSAIVTQGTGGSAVQFAMDLSDDNVIWIQGVTSCLGVVGGATPVAMTYSGISARFMRVRVVLGVASTTISSVTLASSNTPSDTMKTQSGVLTDNSTTTSGTPSTSTQIMAANAQRRYLFIQNNSASQTIYINFTSNATAGSGSIALGPLGSFVQESSFVSQEAVNVLATVASVPFTAKQA
jgi:hypothetical protein